MTSIAELELAINILERIKHQLVFPLMLFNGCSVKVMKTPFAKLHANRIGFINARERLHCLNESLPITSLEKYNNLVRFNETKDQIGFFKLLLNNVSYKLAFGDSLYESAKLVTEHTDKIAECNKLISNFESDFTSILAEYQSSRRYHCSMSCGSPSVLCDIVAKVDKLTRYLSKLITRVSVYKHVCILPDGEMYEARSACKSVYVIMEKSHF